MKERERSSIFGSLSKWQQCLGLDKAEVRSPPFQPGCSPKWVWGPKHLIHVLLLSWMPEWEMEQPRLKTSTRVGAAGSHLICYTTILLIKLLII